jgi:hypothetical protein
MISFGETNLSNNDEVQRNGQDVAHGSFGAVSQCSVVFPRVITKGCHYIVPNNVGSFEE